MAESYNNPPPSGSHHPPPPVGAQDPEPRIDGDGQEVNALRFLGAPVAPPPPAPSITPSSTSGGGGVNSQQSSVGGAASVPAHPQPPQTPHGPSSHGSIPPTPGGGGGYDPYDPYGHGYPQQVPGGPPSGPYPGMMMMMPPYAPAPYAMYANPYGYAPQPAFAPPPQPAQPPSQTQLVAMLNVLRVQNPKVYRDWYKKYQEHRKYPNRVPFPPMPPVPGFGGPGSSQTLPSSYGRSRKESTRSMANGEPPYRHHGSGLQHNDSFLHDYSIGATPSSRGPRRPHSSRGGSMNGGPEDDFIIEGEASGDTSMAAHVGSNSALHSTFNTSGIPYERPPTQSGRSSTLGEPYSHPRSDIYGGEDRQDSISLYEYRREPSPPPRRMTPLKFSTMHCLATLAPLGHVISVRSGHGTVLEFVKMRQLVGHLPEYKELESFPGPLTPGSTHKNTVIQWCKRKISEARSNPAQVDKENYVLLWEFLVLMLRQNGMVVGSDIAELLLNAAEEQKKREVVAQDNSPVPSDKESGEGESSGGEETSSLHNAAPMHASTPRPNLQQQQTTAATPPSRGEEDEKALVEEFCQHLLQGHKKDALEFAMERGLWGHALFFASKMDERSYGHVLARFANGIPLHSPLQTLYHIMCGKQPASVTGCGGEDGFGDWKPHLAMLLSNSGYKPDVEQRAILTLGDTLQQRGHVYAAQFCYLMGHEEFRKESRLGTLLGSNTHGKRGVVKAGLLKTLEAHQMTEVYEFARRLADPHVNLGASFLSSKLDYSKTLLSYGFVEEALAYAEEIYKVLRQAGKYGELERQELLKLAGDTLKIAERIAGADESGTAATTWVVELRKLAEQPGFGGLEEDLRKLSLDGGGGQQYSDQASYSSSSAAAGVNDNQSSGGAGGVGAEAASGSGAIYDPYSSYQQQTSQETHGMSAYGEPQFESTTQSEVSGAVSSLPPEGHAQSETSSNWGGQLPNGGLHLSQQSSVYDPPQIPMIPNSQSQGQGQQQQTQMGMGGAYDGYGTQQQQDSGYQTGYPGPQDKSGMMQGQQQAPPPQQTINNNHWYNPYDSTQQTQQQPQTQGMMGGGGMMDYGKDASQFAPPQHHSSPLKQQRKMVRFEEQQNTTTSTPPRGGNGEGKHASNGVVVGGEVQVQSVVRLRHRDPADLKSALKTSSVGNRQTIKTSGGGVSGLVNGGGDVERCGKVPNGEEEVEFKSTYPIDEPLETYTSSPMQFRRRVVIGHPHNSSSLVPSSKASHAPLSHPFPLMDLQKYRQNNGSSQRGRTYPVDKQCCDARRPCPDHTDDFDDILDDDLEEEEEEGEAGGGACDAEMGEGGNNNFSGSSAVNGHDVGGAPPSPHVSQFQENKTEARPPTQPSAKNAGSPKKEGSKKGGAGGLDGGGGQQGEKGWFSGLFKALKPKNQMILPDDKNPTIVWDPQQKRWVNTAGDGDDDLAPAGPPPKDSELMGGPPKMPGGGAPPPVPMMNGPTNPQVHQQQQIPGGYNPQQQHQVQAPQMMMTQPQQQMPGAYINPQQQNPGLPNPSQGQQQAPQQPQSQPQNRFKLQRGRGAKGYVDILGSSGTAVPSSSPPPPVPPFQQQQQPPGGGGFGGGPGVPAMFIPPPMPQAAGGGGDVSFLTPAPDPPPHTENPHHHVPPDGH